MFVRRRVLLGSDRVGNLGQHPKFGPLLERAPVQ
jgi:hypothetical protein